MPPAPAPVDAPVEEMTYAEQHHPAWVAEVLTLAALVVDSSLN